MEIKIHRFELPLRHTFRISRGGADKQETMIVEVADGAHTGYGECTTNKYYQVTAEDVKEKLLTAVLPTSWNHPSEVYTELRNHFGKNYFAQNALDTALYDLWGKKHNKPTYELLGFQNDNSPLSDYTIGIDTIPKMIKKLKEFNDWPIFKIKLGTDNDIEIIKALREHTDAIFRVDANCGWSAKQTIEYSEKLIPYNVEFIEQPLPADQWDEMKDVYKHSKLPLIADESCIVEEDVEKCVDHFHGINIKLTKCGGISPAVRMIKTAERLGLKKMAGCMTETTVGISAIGQILPALDYVDMDGAVLLNEDVADGVKVRQGKAHYPSTTFGNGITLQRQAVFH